MCGVEAARDAPPIPSRDGAEVEAPGKSAAAAGPATAAAGAASAGASAYCAAKASEIHLARCLALEGAVHGIRVNTVSPGYVVTEGTHTAGITGSEMEAGFVAQTPLGRAGHPGDIADVVAFLASDEARWLTGENITASGGIR